MKVLEVLTHISMRNLVIGVCAFLCLVSCAAFVPHMAYAAPLPVMSTLLADTGACTLPDGSSGVVSGDGYTCCPSGFANSSSCFYTKYINPAIALLGAAVGVVIVIAIVYGGIEYITSEGDPQKAASGKKRIISALVGLVAFMLLYAVLQFLAPGGALNG